MQIIISIYDDGYEEGLLINDHYYDYERTYHIAAYCFNGRYAEMYKEICKMLNKCKLAIPSNIEVVIIDDGYIMKVYYYKYAYVLDSPIYYDVIRPEESSVENELPEEVKNGRS